MNQVRGGQTSFVPRGDSEEDKRDFQCIVSLLQRAYQQGLLSTFKPWSDSDKGDERIILVEVKL